MTPSPIPKWDNPKLHQSEAILLFCAGREKRIYAVPPFTDVRSIDFDDHPFRLEAFTRFCAVCGSDHSYLDEIIVDDAGKRMYVCSDTDFCNQRVEAGNTAPEEAATPAAVPNSANGGGA
jgi:alpha-D-ribose 1-methylphosphonate 5-phosphate C-P lyase